MIDKIKEILADFTDMEIKDMTDDTKLIADMELSSFDIVNIIAEFEDEFDIEIPDSIMKGFDTIGDIADYIKNKI